MVLNWDEWSFVIVWRQLYLPQLEGVCYCYGVDGEPEMLLHILQCVGKPPTTIVWVKVSVVPRWEILG